MGILVSPRRNARPQREVPPRSWEKASRQRSAGRSLMAGFGSGNGTADELAAEVGDGDPAWAIRAPARRARKGLGFGIGISLEASKTGASRAEGRPARSPSRDASRAFAAGLAGNSELDFGAAAIRFWTSLASKPPPVITSTMSKLGMTVMRWPPVPLASKSTGVWPG